MENTEIRCLNQLEASHVQQTAALLVDSFYSMFKGITKERELLQKLCRVISASRWHIPPVCSWI